MESEIKENEYDQPIQKVRFAYTGPAVNQGTMDTDDLIYSLSGFTELVKGAYKITGGKGDLRVFVNTDSFQDGSFEILPLL